MKSLMSKYYLRGQRWRRRLRAIRLRRKLSLHQDNTHLIGEKDVVVFVTCHNELPRLPYFLDYYRKMGVKHFIFIDNNSDDGTAKFLSQFSDVTRYFTKHEYRRAHFGMDWINFLLLKHARNRWALTVDIDEFFVFPHCDKRSINALTDWLDASSIRSFSAQLLDLYPVEPIDTESSLENVNPLDMLTHFDVGNYTFQRNNLYGNLWIQGGVRARLFFSDKPDTAPALNKTPLVKWRRGYVYISSTHSLLPKRLNVNYSDGSHEPICGVLLHTKFLPDLSHKIANPYLLSQHYSHAREYHSYNRTQLNDLDFSSARSVRYEDWRQLDELGIISTGGWA